MKLGKYDSRTHIFKGSDELKFGAKRRINALKKLQELHLSGLSLSARALFVGVASKGSRAELLNVTVCLAFLVYKGPGIQGQK